ncbi:family 1 glycosylhydrolase [Trichococcus paludicola]
MIDCYSRYARTVLKSCKGWVKYWLTTNKTSILLYQSFVGGEPSRSTF